MNKKTLKFVVVLFVANFFLTWISVFAFIYEHFNNVLGFIIIPISFGISLYVHIRAEDYLAKKYNINRDDQN